MTTKIKKTNYQLQKEARWKQVQKTWKTVHTANPSVSRNAIATAVAEMLGMTRQGVLNIIKQTETQQ